MKYKLLENTILLFWDEKQNFNMESTQQKIGPELFQKVERIDSLEGFKTVLNNTENQNQKFLFLIHLFHNDNNKGWLRFKSSKINKEFPDLITYLISSAPKRKIHENGNEDLDVYSYDNYHDKVGTTFIPQTKAEILGLTTISEEQTEATLPKNKSKVVESTEVSAKSDIEFAIITALYKEEFQEVEKIFDWDETKDVITDTRRYRAGHLKGNPSRKIIAAFPTATGMIDAAIIATQILEHFRPSYLIMSGVCAGKKGSKFGDIILAKKIFMFQKGKVSDIKNALGKRIELFDSDKNPVDYNHLYDDNKNQIKVCIEKFEIEIDTVIEMNPVLQTVLEPKLESIKKAINDSIEPFKKSIDILFEPMACSIMVVNKENFFEENIKVVDRKTAAVEMESYGVARACQFANNGKTKFVIFKSVMDNMIEKDDTEKRFAARISAMFLQELIYKGYLK